MGWIFSVDATRRELIRELTAGWKYEGDAGGEMVCLAKTLRGNTMWSLWQHTKKDGSKGDVHIVCHLLSSAGGRHGWGYKDMTERMGPCQVTCPLSYLKAAPVVCKEWRERVLAHHAKLQVVNGVEVGDTLELVPGCSNEELVVESVRPLLCLDGFGRRWRVPRNLVAGVRKKQ